VSEQTDWLDLLETHRPDKVKRVQMPSKEDLHSLLHYDQNTGVLTWRKRLVPEFGKRYEIAAIRAWNGKCANKPAFQKKDSHGYMIGNLCGRPFKAHRIAWKMVYGNDPLAIDHINGDRADNRLENLRAADTITNGRNLGLKKNNTSGVPGVYWSNRDRVWKSQIRANGKIVALGQYRNKDAAIRVRRIAEKAHGYHENNGARPSHARAKEESK
jgi:hypothetical protein